MVRLRYLKQNSIKALLSPLNNNHPFIYSTLTTSTKTTTTNAFSITPIYPPYSSPSHKSQTDDLVLTFREWFKSSGNPLLDQILHILSSNEHQDLTIEHEAIDTALSRLNLHLTQSLVLDVLSYGKNVLSCMQFFDWAGRQPGFHHSRATYHAIFKIISKAKLMSIMFNYLEDFKKHRGHKSNFHNILVMGYAVAGKPQIALQLFGRMRYQGIDLDDFAYHVLLNALVEEGNFDGVESVARQIKNRGFESEVTYSILVKGFCRKKEFEKAENYLRGVINTGVKVKTGGFIVGALVDGLCKNDQFDKAGKLVDEFGEFHAYDVWIRELVRARKVDGAVDFLQKTRNQNPVYVPDVFRYNTLIIRLLRENRLEEVCDLVTEMRENNIPPDELTMNIVLCFFCKAGMVDIALTLYDSRSEIGLTLNSMAINYLMNTLCKDGSVNDAYRIMKNSLDNGFFPGKIAFSIMADALCKVEKVDIMDDLYRVAMDYKINLSDRFHEKYINALCRSGRLMDAYHRNKEINKINSKVTNVGAYKSLINGMIKGNRGDVAADLLTEMKIKGRTPSRNLFCGVIQSICEMENPEKEFQKLLEKQLSIKVPDCEAFNYFIEGAGLAKRPDLAKEVYQLMERSGISPNVFSDLLMLQSYLKSEKISDSLNLFYDIAKKRKIGRKVLNTMVVGLCKANKPDMALSIFMEMREKEKNVRPTLICYEELVYILCKYKRYDKAIDVINDMIQVGRPLSSFIGNNLLLYSLKDQELHNTWVNSLSTKSTELTQSSNSSLMFRLGEVVGLFSDRFREDIDIDDLEEVVRGCFPLDVYTYNMLLRKLNKKQVDDACSLFWKICEKGYEPNQWTYETLVHGLYRHGRVADAKDWLEEMQKRGFIPSEATTVML